MVEATPGHGLRLVFFAETRFVQSLEKAIVRAAPGLSWHEIRLTPFSRDEVRSYLRFRFEEAGWTDNLPFTELQVQELTVDSGGYPGEINQRAGRLLSGDGAKASTGLFPPMHRAVLMLVGAVVGMIWLVWQFGELTGGTDDQAVLDRIARGNQRIEQELARGADSIPESEPTSLEPDPEPAPVQDFWRESGSESELDEHAEAGAHQVPDPEPASEPGADRDPVPAAVSQRETEPAPAPAPEPAPTPEARLPEPEPEPAPVPPPQAETRTEPSVDPRDRFDEYEPAGPTLRPGARGAGWLMRQAPERYTLQLFGTSNLDRMVAYVNRQQDISEFAMLTLERDGEPWYVVTYGLFSTAGAARTAAEKLPSSAGRVDPWVRKVGSVQAHIQQAR
jgi:DamX protein